MTMVMGRSIPLSLATLVPSGQGLEQRGRQQRETAQLHTPVMRAEVLEHLRDAPGGTMVDGTLGLGGHADALLEARDDIHLIGIDRDSDALELADLRLARWSGRYELCRADYRTLSEMSSARGWAPIAAILIDLGASSLQLGTAERGFSFRLEGPLDMRMDQRQPRTAAELVDRLSGDEFRSLIRDYGGRAACRPHRPRHRQGTGNRADHHDHTPGRDHRRRCAAARTTADSSGNTHLPGHTNRHKRRARRAARVRYWSEPTARPRWSPDCSGIPFAGRPCHQACVQAPGQRLRMSTGAAAVSLRQALRSQDSDLATVNTR